MSAPRHRQFRQIARGAVERWEFDVAEGFAVARIAPNPARGAARTTFTGQVEPLVDGRLLEVRQDVDHPRKPITAPRRRIASGRKDFVLRGVDLAGEGDLPGVVAALRPPGRLAGSLDGRQEHGHEQRDDRDHDEQLDERHRGPRWFRAFSDRGHLICPAVRCPARVDGPHAADVPAFGHQTGIPGRRQWCQTQGSWLYSTPPRSVSLIQRGAGARIRVPSLWSSLFGPAAGPCP